MRLLYFLPGILWWYLSYYLFTIPGSKLPKASWLDVHSPHFDKLVHIGLFGGLMITFGWGAYKAIRNARPVAYKCIYLLFCIFFLLFGVAVEYIQVNKGRSYSFEDIMADAIGCLAGLSFCLWNFTQKSKPL